MSLKCLFILRLLLVLFLVTPLVAQKTYPGPFKILKDNFFKIPQEAKNIVLYPFQHPNKTFKFAGISLALIAIDKPTTKFTQRAFNHTFDVNFVDIFPVFGGRDGYIMGGIMTLYAGSVLFKYETGQEAALASMKAALFSYVYTHLILKQIFGRQRPHSDLSNPNFDDTPKTTNNWDFFNFHNPTFHGSQYGTAFPSFHITYAFAVARALQRTFNNTLIPYAFVISLNLMDFHGHAHWVSDMVAGAMIGHMIGSMVTGGVEPKKIGKGYIKPNLGMVTNPFNYNQYPALSLTYQF